MLILPKKTYWDKSQKDMSEVHLEIGLKVTGKRQDTYARCAFTLEQCA